MNGVQPTPEPGEVDINDAGPEYVILPNEYKTMLSPNTTLEKEDGGGDTTKYKASNER